MASALQPVVQPPLINKRSERVLRVAPVEVTLDLGDALIAELHRLATASVEQELEQRMRLVYRSNPQAAIQLDPAAADEDDFIQRHRNDPQIRGAAQIPSYERYTFFSPTGNVQFDSAEFETSDLPKDLEIVTAHADGPNGRFIDIHLQTKFADFTEVRSWQLNQIIIQGEDPNWVNAVYEKLRRLIEPQQFKTRAFIYGNCLKLFWFSVVLLLFAEYRLARWLNPGFTLEAPLSGTGALVMFGVLTASLLVFANTVIAIFTHWFPYFELEGNLSRSRTASRKAVTAVISTLYTAAIVNVLMFLFRPLWTQWIGTK